MRKILYGLFLITVCSNVFSNEDWSKWEKLDDYFGAFSFDRSSIKMTKQKLRTVNVIFNEYKHDDAVDSLVYNVQIDCKKRTLHPLKVTAYPTPYGKGQPIALTESEAYNAAGGLIKYDETKELEESLSKLINIVCSVEK